MNNRDKRREDKKRKKADREADRAARYRAQQEKERKQKAAAVKWKTLFPPEMAPPSVRFMMLPDSISPVRDHELKIMIFTTEEAVKQFVAQEYTATDDELRQIRAAGMIHKPTIVCIGQKKWELFQAEQAGDYNEYDSVEAARAAMQKKRDKFCPGGVIPPVPK